ASSSPQVVRVPLSVEAAVDPEEALVASLSSCHMLFFLAFAAAGGWRVDDYSDEALGVMGKNAAGRIAMVRVSLTPRVAFPGERTELAFSAAAPADFPEALEGAVIERVGTHQYRIASAPREWLIEATAVHVHRDIAVPFYRAIPPRRVPLAKRIFWRVVLALAATRTGLALLRRLRR